MKTTRTPMRSTGARATGRVVAAAIACLLLGLATTGPATAQNDPDAAASCGSGPLNGRTQAVVDAIVAEVPGVTACSDVTSTYLADITGTLYLSDHGLTAQRPDDLDGLSSLRTLSLSSNQLATLLEGVFAGLWSLSYLWLGNNQLTALPADVFAGLSSLEWLYLSDNPMGDLEPAYFESQGLTGLKTLTFGDKEPSAQETAAYRGCCPDWKRSAWPGSPGWTSPPRPRRGNAMPA